MAQLAGQLFRRHQPHQRDPYNVYDAAGNSQDPSPYTQTWHAENRHITKDAPTSYYTSTAQFDGKGRIVQTSCLPGDRGRLVVYNAFGEHVADYARH